MYELTGSDPYAQNREGIYLEYLLHVLKLDGYIYDIGSGDGFHLSNSRHLYNIGYKVLLFDKLNGLEVRLDNCTAHTASFPTIISIDIDGYDYWILDKQLPFYQPPIVIAEFNPAFSDSRTIKYNPDHVWDGTDYYGFSFEAGKKLFEKHGYKVIFNVANMNMIAVRQDLINVAIPPVTYQVTEFFEKSVGREWIMV
jgi:hypothetical protein